MKHTSAIRLAGVNRNDEEELSLSAPPPKNPASLPGEKSAAVLRRVRSISNRLLLLINMERGTVEEPPDLAFSPRLQKYGFETRPRPRKKENPLSRFLLLVNKSKPVRNSDTGVLTHSAQQKVVTHP